MVTIGALERGGARPLLPDSVAPAPLGGVSIVVGHTVAPRVLVCFGAEVGDVHAITVGVEDTNGGEVLTGEATAVLFDAALALGVEGVPGDVARWALEQPPPLDALGALALAEGALALPSSGTMEQSTVSSAGWMVSPSASMIRARVTSWTRTGSRSSSAETVAMGSRSWSSARLLDSSGAAARSGRGSGHLWSR